MFRDWMINMLCNRLQLSDIQQWTSILVEAQICDSSGYTNELKVKFPT